MDLFDEWGGADEGSMGAASPNQGTFRSTIGSGGSDTLGHGDGNDDNYGLEGKDMIDDEDIIFSINSLEFNSSEDMKRGRNRSRLTSSTLEKMSCGGTVVCISTGDNHVVRFKLDDVSYGTVEVFDVIEVRSSKSDDMINNIFMDPTGNHLLVAFKSGETYYLHSSSMKPRQMKKLYPSVIQSVAWNKREGSALSTSQFLLGTTNGVILECCISDSKEKYVKPVYTIDKQIPIHGLELEYFNHLSNNPKFFVMATTASPTTMCYQFIGGPTLERMFDEYTSSKYHHTDLPGSLSYSELHFYREELESKPKRFALLTAVGIWNGTLEFGDQKCGDDVIAESETLTLDVSPISIAVTDFHFLALYNNHLSIRNRLNNEIISTHSFDRGGVSGQIKSLVMDPSSNSLWLLRTNKVYQIHINRENRDIWKVYLDRAVKGDENSFIDSYTFCQDASQREIVRVAQADFLFNQQRYIESARHYAVTTSRLFEEVALQFIDNDQVPALKLYLIEKLNSYSPRYKTQKTLLSTWIVEIYLGQLNTTSPLTWNEDKASNSVEEEFLKFLEDNESYLDPTTTFDLISSHGRVEELLFYANLIEDYEKLVTYHIQRGEYDAVLTVLSNATPEKVDTLYYSFSPTLILNVPSATVNSWKRAPFLNPCNLIPALVRYTQQREKDLADMNSNGVCGVGQDEAIRYLEYTVFVNQNTEPAIHNYLFSLYATSSNDQNNANLLSFLHNEEIGGILDLNYALRVCTQQRKLRVCVHIYGMMGLFEEAVDLALKVDSDLAKLNADRPDDDCLRKKLWLRIARHAIEVECDIKKAIDIVRSGSERPGGQGEDVIRIEDILPFFPDFVIIDEFKEEICNSVKDYNVKIDQLKIEMDEYTDSAERIRSDIKQLRGRYGYISGTQKCDLCKKSVLSRRFYLFPCTHAFHADCMTREVMKHLNSTQRKRVNQLEQNLKDQKDIPDEPSILSSPRLNNENASLTSLSDNLTAKREILQTELDNIVACECIWCGRMMIKSISEPLVGDNEKEAEGWKL